MLRWATRVGVTRLLISRPCACGGALRTASHVGTRALACALLQAASSAHSASQLLHAVQPSNLDRPGILQPRASSPCARARASLRGPLRAGVLAPLSILARQAAGGGMGGPPSRQRRLVAIRALSPRSPRHALHIVGTRTQLRPAIRTRACRESVPELSRAAAAAAAQRRVSVRGSPWPLLPHLLPARRSVTSFARRGTSLRSAPPGKRVLCSLWPRR